MGFQELAAILQLVSALAFNVTIQTMYCNQAANKRYQLICFQWDIISCKGRVMSLCGCHQQLFVFDSLQMRHNAQHLLQTL